MVPDSPNPLPVEEDVAWPLGEAPLWFAVGLDAELPTDPLDPVEIGEVGVPDEVEPPGERPVEVEVEDFVLEELELELEVVVVCAPDPVVLDMMVAAVARACCWSVDVRGR